MCKYNSKVEGERGRWKGVKVCIGQRVDHSIKSFIILCSIHVRTYTYVFE